MMPFDEKFEKRNFLRCQTIIGVFRRTELAEKFDYAGGD